MLINAYLNDGYDPREIYEREEKMYKDAVRILKPINLRYGIKRKHHVANRIWTDWRYATNRKKTYKKSYFQR